MLALFRFSVELTRMTQNHGFELQSTEWAVLYSNLRCNSERRWQVAIQGYILQLVLITLVAGTCLKAEVSEVSIMPCHNRKSLLSSVLLKTSEYVAAMHHGTLYWFSCGAIDGSKRNSSL